MLFNRCHSKFRNISPKQYKEYLTSGVQSCLLKSISHCAPDVLRDGDQLAGGVHLVALRVALRPPGGVGRQGQARLQYKPDVVFVD